MVGVIRTYGQEPPHCYNAQVSVQMTNALRTNLSKLSTSLQSQRYGAWWRSLYKHTGRSVHIMHDIVVLAITIVQVRLQMTNALGFLS